MHVALVCPFSLSYFGGVQKHCLCLREEFEKLGVSSKIIAPRRDARENYGDGVALLGSSFVLPGNASRFDLSFASPWDLEELLAQESFDVLHFHSLPPFLGMQILELSPKFKTLNLYTAHSNVDQSLVAQAFPWLLTVLSHHFSAKIDGVIAVSRKAGQMVEDFRGPRTFIPNGVDLKVYSPTGPKVKAFDDGRINILFVGRLDERKGVSVLLKAFAALCQKYVNLRLMIVGEGFLETQLENFLAAKGNYLSGLVERLGAVPEADLAKLYRTAQIFCAPSLGGESFGMVLLEAMASGLPVVASDIEGYREVLTGKGADLLTKANDEKDLTRVLAYLIESSAARRRYGRWGLGKVEKYSWGKIAKKVLAFYERVRKSKR